MPFAVVLLLALTQVFTTPASASAVVSIKGAHGEVLTTSSATFKGSSTVTVAGTYFDESVGIYLAYCVKQPAGVLPSPCGGGENKTGKGISSYWISSNPPPYGRGLALPYKAGGRFSYPLKVTTKIGTVDCRKVTCAITVRADHLNSNDRSYDMYIPVKFTK